MSKVTRLLVLIFVFTVALMTTGESTPASSSGAPQKGNIRCFCGGNPIVVVEINRGGDELHTGCKSVLEKVTPDERKQVCTKIWEQVKSKGGNSCKEIADLCPASTRPNKEPECQPDKKGLCSDLRKVRQEFEDLGEEILQRNLTGDDLNQFTKKVDPLIDQARADSCDSQQLQEEIDTFKHSLDGWVKNYTKLGDQKSYHDAFSDETGVLAQLRLATHDACHPLEVPFNERKPTTQAVTATTRVELGR